mmetsp:Transcript_30217/g.72067  ORF Transcript_30217/g.72067 Transcript_30217/m.72067 type:complete len:287 (+) Transcript_30217:221-1081(+)
MPQVWKPKQPQGICALLLQPAGQIASYRMRWNNGVLAGQHHQRRHHQLLRPQQILIPEEVPGQTMRDEELASNEVVHQQLRGRLRPPVHEVVANIWLDEKEADWIQESCNFDSLLGVLTHPGNYDGTEGVADKVSRVEFPAGKHVPEAGDHLGTGRHILIDSHRDVRQGYQEDSLALRHLPQQLCDEVLVWQQVDSHPVAKDDWGLCTLAPATTKPVLKCTTLVLPKTQAFKVAVRHDRKCEGRHNVVEHRAMLGWDGIHRQAHGLHVRVVPLGELNAGPNGTFIY